MFIGHNQPPGFYANPIHAQPFASLLRADTPTSLHCANCSQRLTLRPGLSYCTVKVRLVECDTAPDVAVTVMV